jgi:hypothetical protein
VAQGRVTLLDAGGDAGHHGSQRVASAGWILTKVASKKWIPWLPQKNPARQDRDFLTY